MMSYVYWPSNLDHAGETAVGGSVWVGGGDAPV